MKIPKCINVDLTRVEICESNVGSLDDYMVERYDGFKTDTFEVCYNDRYYFFDVNNEGSVEPTNPVIHSHELQSDNLFELSEEEIDYYKIVYGDGVIEDYLTVIKNIEKDIKFLGWNYEETGLMLETVG